MANPNRVAEVNRALKERGVPERLKRGRGYYFFCGGDAALWPTASVMVFRSEELSVANWLYEYDRLKAEGNR